MALKDPSARKVQPALQRQSIMTIKPSFPLAALGRLWAPALACAILVGGTLPALAQFGTTACTYRTNDLGKLPAKIEEALGLARGTAQVPIIIIPTFDNNLSQSPVVAGITLCTNSQSVASVSSSNESQPFPSGGPADIQEIQQTSYVLVNGNLMRICQSDQETECVVITKK